MRIYFIISACLLVLGCSQESSGGAIERGKVINGDYQNNFFRFSIGASTPWGFSIMDRENVDSLYEEVMAPYEERQGMRLKGRKAYFSLCSIGIEKSNASLPVIQVYAVDKKALIGIASALDYLGHLKNRLPSSQSMKAGELVLGELGGREFWALSTEIFGIRKVEYATLIRDHVIVFEVTYRTLEELKFAKNVLHTIRFDLGDK